MTKSKIKSIVICFFDSQCVVNKEVMPQGQKVLSWGPWTTQKKDSSCPARDCGYLDAASLKRSLSSYHLRERMFDQIRHSSCSTSPKFAWSESMRLLPFPETQIPSPKSLFWNCGQHPKGRDRTAENTSTWRTPAPLPGVGANSAAVCGFPRELLWRR